MIARTLFKIWNALASIISNRNNRKNHVILRIPIKDIVEAYLKKFSLLSLMMDLAPFFLSFYKLIIPFN